MGKERIDTIRNLIIAETLSRKGGDFIRTCYEVCIDVSLEVAKVFKQLRAMERKKGEDET